VAGPPAFPARLEPGCSGRIFRLSRVRAYVVATQHGSRRTSKLYLSGFCSPLPVS
jgi:hypothetical protein